MSGKHFRKEFVGFDVPRMSILISAAATRFATVTGTISSSKITDAVHPGSAMSWRTGR